MWQKTHSIFVNNLKAENIWKIWSDISRRTEWDTDTEWAELKGPFEQGAVFKFKPKGGPTLSMTITESVPNQVFTDCFKIPFAKMYGIHRMQQVGNDLNIMTTIKVEGPLGWFLRKLVAEKVVAELPEQTMALINLARKEP